MPRETCFTNAPQAPLPGLTAPGRGAFMSACYALGGAYRPKTSGMNNSTNRRESGFTLIELMVTMIVLAILLGVGVPSFNVVLLNSRTAALANDLTSALNLARSEAVTRAAQVDVCPSDNGTGCTGAWTDGWIVIVNGGAVLRVYPAPREAATITQTPTANTAIAFGPLGQPIGGTTAIFTQIDGCRGERARQIDVAPAGRVSTSRVPCV